MTRHVNLSTLTENEVSTFFGRLPDQNTIYIGIPYLWRDRKYIDNKNVTRILKDSVRIFSTYNKTRNNFKYGKSVDDLKKISAYKNSRLCQIADEINDYSKLFKKKKKVKDRPKKVMLEEAVARERRIRREFGRNVEEMPTPEPTVDGVDRSHSVFTRMVGRTYGVMEDNMVEENEG